MLSLQKNPGSSTTKKKSWDKPQYFSTLICAFCPWHKFLQCYVSGKQELGEK